MLVAITSVDRHDDMDDWVENVDSDDEEDDELADVVADDELATVK